VDRTEHPDGAGFKICARPPPATAQIYRLFPEQHRHEAQELDPVRLNRQLLRSTVHHATKQNRVLPRYYDRQMYPLQGFTNKLRQLRTGALLSHMRPVLKGRQAFCSVRQQHRFLIASAMCWTQVHVQKPHAWAKAACRQVFNGGFQTSLPPAGNACGFVGALGMSRSFLTQSWW